ncbi:hypothetical protein LMG27177_06956 [Paraburkholderia fynbosensis]|uniref:Uncharacterized protein n=1 Tax=Paraburkholderia fynbosensis TaxID=1200993 RepID=A0A6J5H394_9BURK|nr:hypothetical protein LMG27177_06956 [Paraburkholderia fynbosensis]
MVELIRYMYKIPVSCPVRLDEFTVQYPAGRLHISIHVVYYGSVRCRRGPQTGYTGAVVDRDESRQRTLTA